MGGDTAVAQGTIRYVQPFEPIYATQGRFIDNFGLRLPLDLNGDMVTDYEFTGNIFGVSVQAQGSNRQLAFLAIPPDLGSYLYPLALGETIGATPPLSLAWVDSQTPRHPIPAQSAVSGCVDTGCGGLFLGITAYMGVQFAAQDGMHYGWVRIDAPSFEGGGIILDWAYETRPGEAILAGAVPEPSTWALLSIGGFLFLFCKRKKRMA